MNPLHACSAVLDERRERETVRFFPQCQFYQNGTTGTATFHKLKPGVAMVIYTQRTHASLLIFSLAQQWIKQVAK